jgi:hypothetical protein
MRQHNAENERIKREYLIYLKAANLVFPDRR